MRPFPGKLKRVKEGYVLNGWQRRWLHEVYPTNTNKEICKAMGINTNYVLSRLVEGILLEKDEEWMYYERCRHIGKDQNGCAVVHDVSIQTSTITIATKLSRKDYAVLCDKAKKAKKTKYHYIQNIIRQALKA